MKFILMVFAIFGFVGVTPLHAEDEFDYEQFAENDVAQDFSEYDIEQTSADVGECAVTNVAINTGNTPVAVAGFDIAGIMLGMTFDVAQMTARETGLYVNRPKGSVVYSIHPDWRDNLDYECQQRGIFIPEKLNQCINSLARNRGLLYASELHLVRTNTGETIDVFFTSNATDNVVWKIVYKNDADEYEGASNKFVNQRDKKIMAWWKNVVDKYGAPNAGTDKWASSDNAYDPLMIAYHGELDIVDCGILSEDSNRNIRQSMDNFVAKPYAF